jgi:hypothetical protein
LIKQQANRQRPLYCMEEPAQGALRRCGESDRAGL